MMNALQLKKVLDSMSKLVGSRPPLPINTCALVRVSGSQITITATNLEHALKVEITDSNYEDITFVVDIKSMIKLLGKPSKISQVEFVRNAEREIKVNIDGLDYFVQEQFCWEDFLVLDTGILKPIYLRNLKDGLCATRHALADDNSRYNLDMLCIEDHSETTLYVTTDGNRLASYAYPPVDVLQTKKTTNQLLVQKSAVNWLTTQKIMNLGDMKVDTEFNSRYLQITDRTDFFCKKIFTTRLGEGEYPAFRKVFPAEPTSYFQVNRKQLVDNITRLLPLTDERNRGLNFSANGSVVVEKSGTVTESRCNYSRGSAEWIMNGEYILDTLKSFPDDTLNIHYTKEGSPIAFVPDHCSYYHLVMPMRK